MTTLRVGNCSGFYGDRLSAMREMLEGGELDVLTGDYLAELTMLILGKDTMRTPRSATRAPTSPRSSSASAWRWRAACGLVSNAGGLDPAGLADRLREVAAGLRLDAGSRTSGRHLRPLAKELELGDNASPQRLPRRLGVGGLRAAPTWS